MKTIQWIGSKGNKIELRAECKMTVRPRILDADGDRFECGKELNMDANLELWVDGAKKDSCRDTNFWKLIDANGIKKIWGLNVGMCPDQAEKVEAFLKAVIEEGKSAEAREFEAEKAAEKKAEAIAEAKEIIAKAEKTARNNNGTLMTATEAAAWRRRYNNINNEGGYGYVPEVITQELYEYAQATLKN
jgi:hypothetical protein